MEGWLVHAIYLFIYFIPFLEKEHNCILFFLCNESRTNERNSGKIEVQMDRSVRRNRERSRRGRKPRCGIWRKGRKVVAPRKRRRRRRRRKEMMD
jgi:hypothetical protein